MSKETATHTLLHIEGRDDQLYITKIKDEGILAQALQNIVEEDKDLLSIVTFLTVYHIAKADNYESWVLST